VVAPTPSELAWLMAQPEGQTREPLSYQFQFVLCVHHGQSVDAGLDCTCVRLSVMIGPLLLRFELLDECHEVLLF
jgi:hypothetical protein